MAADFADALTGHLLSSLPVDVRAFLSSIAVIAACVSVGCVNKPAGSPLCADQGVCADGSVCVVGRCRLAASTIVPSPQARRLVLFPEAIAAATPDERGGGQHLPATVWLGRGSSTVFLRFSVPVSDPADVTAAFVVVESSRDALAPAGPVPVDLAEILDLWQADAVSDGRIPRVGVPSRAGVISGSFGGPYRFDVTHLVKRWAKRDGDDHGLALIADDVDAYGAPVSLGVTEGRGPYLEVYLR